MPLATQLALSIELTKVFKLVRSLPSTVEQVFELARSLQVRHAAATQQPNIPFFQADNY
jgi:hypothetical protein